MNYPDTITLELKAKHFKDTVYGNTCDCAISKAFKEHTGIKKVSEGFDNIIILGKKGTRYYHDEYTSHDFQKDRAIASDNNYDDTVISTLILTKERAPSPSLL